MKQEVYKKDLQGNFYSIGEEWEGFPANGLWYVKDNSRNCLTQANFSLIPPFLPALTIKSDECADYINKQIEKAERYSYVDCAKYAAEFYAELLTKETQPQLFL